MLFTFYIWFCWLHNPFVINIGNGAKICHYIHCKSFIRLYCTLHLILLKAYPFNGCNSQFWIYSILLITVSLPTLSHLANCMFLLMTVCSTFYIWLCWLHITLLTVCHYVEFTTLCWLYVWLSALSNYVSRKFTFVRICKLPLILEHRGVTFGNFTQLSGAVHHLHDTVLGSGSGD